MAERIYVTRAHGSIEPLEETAFAAEDEPERLIAELPEFLGGEQMRPGDPRLWFSSAARKALPKHRQRKSDGFTCDVRMQRPPVRLVRNPYHVMKGYGPTSCVSCGRDGKAPTAAARETGMGLIYCFLDIEVDGPTPGENSMLSLGIAAFNEDEHEVGRFEINFETLEGACGAKNVMRWWRTQPEAWSYIRRDPVPPAVGMEHCFDWLEGLGPDLAPAGSSSLSWPATIVVLQGTKR